MTLAKTCLDWQCRGGWVQRHPVSDSDQEESKVTDSDKNVLGGLKCAKKSKLAAVPQIYISHAVASTHDTKPEPGEWTAIYLDSVILGSQLCSILLYAIG